MSTEPASTELALPDLGEGIESADVVAVLVAVGDTVEVEQGLIEIETDKASVEVPATTAGRVTAIHVNTGDEIRTGAPLVTVEPVSVEAAAEAAVREPAAEVTAEQPVEAETGAGAAGAVEAAPTPSSEPAPAPAEVPSAVAATAPSAQPAEEQTGPPPAAEPAAASAAAGVAAAASTDGQSGQSAVAAAPSVRRFAREIGVDVRRVAGSGPGGRVSEQDVKAHARAAGNGATAPSVPASGGPAATLLPDLSVYGEISREPMSRVRRTTATNIARSWAQSPHVTLFQKADVTELEALRKRLKPRVAEAGGNLTMLAILVKMVATGLVEHPKLNAAIDMQAQEVVHRHYRHIGVAMDAPRGLLVPVIRDADRKTITELSVEIVELAGRARDGKLGLDEMRGGTFTISNLGFFGTGFFTPILNPPEVGILGVGLAEPEAVFVDGQLQERLRMPLSLSFDHRLVDGVDGARLLSWLVDALEEPLLLAL